MDVHVALKRIADERAAFRAIGAAQDRNVLWQVASAFVAGAVLMLGAIALVWAVASS